MNRQNFLQIVRDRMTTNDCEKDMACVARAYWLAKTVHREEKRNNGERYFEHCRRVACRLLDRGKTTADGVIIALLHDCLEEGFIPDNVMETLFGKRVSDHLKTLSKIEIVFAADLSVLSKQRKSDDEYFNAIHEAPRDIRLIKLDDRLDNLSDMADSWSQDRARQQRYIIETEKYILPIARMTDEQSTCELEKMLNSIKGGL